MEASATFDCLLMQVQNSKLNFKVDLSPFSAVISLKKTFIKDRFGNVQLLAPDLPRLNCLQSENEAYEILDKVLKQKLLKMKKIRGKS